MKNRKLLRAAAALLLVGIVGVASVGCSFEFEQPEWVTQALCDHVFDEEEVLKEATCTEDGKIQKTCSDCGKTKITTVKATGHDVVEDEGVDATCTTPGLTAGSHCTVCGEVLVKQEEVVGEHDYGEVYECSRSCTTDVIEYESECRRCGDIVCTHEEVFDVPHFDKDEDGDCDYCGNDLLDALKGAERVPSNSFGIPAEGWYDLQAGVAYVFTIESVECTITDTSSLNGPLDFNPSVGLTDTSQFIMVCDDNGLIFGTIGDFEVQEGLGYYFSHTDSVFVVDNDYFYLPKTIEMRYSIGRIPEYYDGDVGAEGICTLTLDTCVGITSGSIRLD